MAKAKRRKPWPRCDGVVVRGRLFSQRDLVLIRRLIREHGTWGRTRLSQEVCKSLGWTQPDRRPKERACRVALLRLEDLGFLRLPARLVDRGGQPPKRYDIAELGVTISPLREMPRALDLTLVTSTRDSRIWNSLVSKFHYLGLPAPVGRLLRYLILADKQLIGAISFGESAWRLADRDRLLNRVGINIEQTRSAVVSNNRFLILPSIQVGNLASRILGQSLRQLTEDWPERFLTTPCFAETFVDPSRFIGTCYQASNWVLVGTTKGFSKQGSWHRKNLGPKLIFMRGLSKAAHESLVVAARENQTDEGPIAA